MGRCARAFCGELLAAATTSIEMAETALATAQVIPVESIERKIYLIRGCKVMLDSDLAGLYQVPTKALNQAVRRNLDRFPADFMFQLNLEELENLRSQIVTSSLGHGGRRYQPFAFTEHGVAMLSSVLASKRAIQLNILIIRAFVRLREYLSTHQDLARKLEDVERTQQEHGAHIQQIYGYIERLLDPAPEPSKRPIGFGN
jgi:phage regulator Rha-like protein